MTCDASSDFGLTTSDFDFSLECGAFKDALRQAFMQAVNLQGVAPLLDTELDELNAAGDGMRPDQQGKNRFEMRTNSTAIRRYRNRFRRVCWLISQRRRRRYAGFYGGAKRRPASRISRRKGCLSAVIP